MGIDVHLDEDEVYPPPEAFRAQANVTDEKIYERAEEDPEAFWADQAGDLEWSRTWDRVLDWDPPNARWFVGGKLNASASCLDRHLDSRADAPAILWESEDGERRTLSFGDLHAEVCRTANALSELGVEQGDRVTTYLPMIPELPVTMLACARLGAIHNVVFAGFSPTAVAGRMEDAASDLLVTCDGYLRRGDEIPQKARADEAADAVGAETVLVAERTGAEVPWTEGRDRRWDEVVDDQPATRDPEPMASTDPLFIMYTSGTTGAPKGVVHGTGGYLTGVQATSRWVLDLGVGDVHWCMADIGWITGHSYIVYGPLAVGATTLMYEGAPDWPAPDRPWEIVDAYDVEVLYTAPTAIRAFMRRGTGPLEGHDLSSLRLLGTVGEPINPSAWRWYREEIGGGRCPVVDTWWQTETGQMMIAPLPGVTPTKPGSATRPLPGIDAAVLDDDGDPVPPGEGGTLAVRRPWPAMLQGIWGDEERYRETYWSEWDEATYYPGDGARIDEDGDIWILGRLDDVLNTAGHRLSTMELESALVGHPAVAEAAVVGADDDVKGEVPVAFVVLEEGTDPSEALRSDLVERVEEEIGPIARPDGLVFCPDLPKTRSGKIMRRVLTALAEGREPGDVTTLSNPDTVEELAERIGT